MQTITFEGKKYPARELMVQGFGEITISTESLEEVLISNDEYVSDDARRVDEMVCFYVPDNHIDWPESDLIEYVEIMLDERTIASEFQKSRAKQLLNNLIAEMIKGDLMNEGDVDDVDIDAMSLSDWYKIMTIYFEQCENAVKNTAMSKQEYYDWLTEEVGLRLVEIDLLEGKGVINVPNLKEVA